MQTILKKSDFSVSWEQIYCQVKYFCCLILFLFFNPERKFYWLLADNFSLDRDRDEEKRYNINILGDLNLK